MFKQRLSQRRDSGFSLAELLVVVAVLIALAAVSIPVFLNQKENTEDAALRQNLTTASTFVSAAIASGETTLAMNGPSPYEGRMIDYIESVGYWMNGGDYWIKVSPSLDQYCITSVYGGNELYYDTSRGGIVDTQGDECVLPYSYD